MKQYLQGDDCPEKRKFYKKTAIVVMWKQFEPFECQSREGTLTGEAGDFLAQDGHGGFYPISAEFHRNNYEEVYSYEKGYCSARLATPAPK